MDNAICHVFAIAVAGIFVYGGGAAICMIEHDEMLTAVFSLCTILSTTLCAVCGILLWAREVMNLRR